LIGAPLTALSSTSATLAGNIVIGGGAAGRTGGALLGALRSVATPEAGGAERLSSLELQLEIPNAASSDNTSTVPATRAGVHSDFPVLILFIADTSYSSNSDPK
jgi:hypothetical protein